MADSTGVRTRHPDWTDMKPQWDLMRHAASGEQVVKDQNYIYLPMPSGFAGESDGGAALYEAYKKRAQFPEIMSPTVRGMLGVVHRRDAQIEMPDAMQPLWERATADGLSLETLHRRITSELLLTGRTELLADAAPEGSDIPWLAVYTTEGLINWDEDRSLFVLDESGIEREDFQWLDRERYRVLLMGDSGYEVQMYEGGEPVGTPISPRGRGGEVLQEIPLVVMGARDLLIRPEQPPLLGVARSSIAQYQLSADYRWQLFMTGQETLFIINADSPDAVGAGVTVSLKGGDRDNPPNAMYVGPKGSGISAHRTAIQDERTAAAQAGARMFDSDSRTAESGDALRIRYAAQTATLTSISVTSAQGLEQGLRHVAMMMGQNPDDVTVTPNLSFLDTDLDPESATKLVKLWQDGVIGYETLYANLQRGGIASMERTSEEELEMIDDEDAEDEDPGLLPSQRGSQPPPGGGPQGPPSRTAPPEPE